MIGSNVRANGCSHAAIIGSLIAVTPMNRGIEAGMRDVRAKVLSFFIWKKVISLQSPQRDYPYQNQYYNPFLFESFLFD